MWYHCFFREKDLKAKSEELEDAKRKLENEQGSKQVSVCVCVCAFTEEEVSTES